MDTKGHILSDSVYMKCLGRGSVEGEIGPNYYGNRVPFWGNGSAVELHNTVNMLKTTEVHILKWWILCYRKYISVKNAIKHYHIKMYFRKL